MIRSILLLVLTFLSLEIYAKDVTATAWLVASADGDIIDSVNMHEERSIASITKLMTAMVVLDARLNLNEQLKPYTRRELLQLAIVHSDNNASEKLCRTYPGGRSACIEAMNSKARSLGMLHTGFSDPTGLGNTNRSTAYDLVKLVQAAHLYPEIVAASKMSVVKIERPVKVKAKTKNKKNIYKTKTRYLVFRNTNPLVATKDFIVSKTGYIRASGGCIVMMLDTDLGRRIVVLLNSKNTKTRIPEAYGLATTTY
jgi:D-alanyl-D-alanine endopeptidase (penicillin-binding protein 7)